MAAASGAGFALEGRRLDVLHGDALDAGAHRGAVELVLHDHRLDLPDHVVGVDLGLAVGFGLGLGLLGLLGGGLGRVLGGLGLGLRLGGGGDALAALRVLLLGPAQRRVGV